jgi:putative ABC transport system permease protein
MHHARIVRNIRLGVRNLSLHALRSLLTVLGIVFGVGSVIAMLSVGEGASQQALEQIRKLGSNNILLTAIKDVRDQSSGAQRVRMSIYGLTYADADRIATYPHVKVVVPAKVVRKEARLGERSMELRIVGTTPQWFTVLNRTMIAGRPLSAYDEAAAAPVCVLTEHGARRLLATEQTIGQVIRIHGVAYTVVGIIRSEQMTGSLQAPDQNIDAYIPLSLARQRYGDVAVQRKAGSRQREMVELHQILVQVDSTEQVEQTAAAIQAMLARFHKNKDYHVSVPLELMRQARQTRRTFNIVLGSIAGISLLVGGIGIMNIMLATVTERTREIGIRRAIGAKRRQVVAQFLTETTVLTLLGGLLGIGIGVSIPWLITTFANMPTVVTPWSVLLSLGISLGVGIIFGLYPAIRAAKLDPIEALRHE